MPEEKNLIPCKISPSIELKVGEEASEFISGCSVIQADFPSNKGCKIGLIKFKNSYTASISVRIKFKDDEKGKQTVWKTVLKDYILMPSPHHEFGSQDYFQINVSKEFSFQPENIIVVRLVLRQPSPHWTSFDIEDLEFYLPSEISKAVEPSCVPECGEDLQAERECIENQDKNAKVEQHHDINVTGLLSNLNKMASLAKDVKMRNSLKDSASGRFDVDGKYDLNLLSYT